MITIKEIKDKLDKIKIQKPDLIIYPQRGGMLLAMLTAYKLNVRNLIGIDIQTYDNKNKKKPFIEDLSEYQLNKIKKAKRILVIDDIIDSGATIQLLEDKYLRFKKYEILTIIDKKDIAEYVLISNNDKDWIDFEWGE